MNMLKLASFYKDNDDRIYSYIYLNNSTNMYEVHCYEYDFAYSSKEFSELSDAVTTAEGWVQ